MNLDSKIWDKTYKSLGEIFATTAKIVENSERKKFFKQIEKEGKIIINHLQVKKYEKILDIGCGSTGKITIPAAKAKIFVCGIDISPEAIKIIKGRVKKLKINKFCHFIIYDVNNNSLPFKRNTFDGVVCSLLLQHVKNLKKLISEISRVVKPGKKIYLSRLYNKFYIFNIPYLPITWLSEKTRDGRAKIYFHSFSEIEKTLKSNNIKILKVGSFYRCIPIYLSILYSRPIIRFLLSKILSPKKINRLSKDNPCKSINYADSWVILGEKE